MGVQHCIRPCIKSLSGDIVPALAEEVIFSVVPVCLRVCLSVCVVTFVPHRLSGGVTQGRFQSIFCGIFLSSSLRNLSVLQYQCHF